jgi:hypothetical protein
VSGADGVPPIPRPLLEAAAAAGLSQTAIVKRWRQYAEWHQRTHGTQEYRMLDWERHIGWELADAPPPSTADDKLAASRLKAGELEQAIAEELYEREAVTFGDWVKTLEARDAGHGEALPPTDKAFLAWRRALLLRNPRDPRAWGLTALMLFGAENPCACVGGALACGGCGKRGRHKVTRAPTVAKPELTAEELEERRQQALRDLGEFAAGLGLEGTGT